MEKFRNKYRIPSTRLQTWDYGWNGSYFVTICTLNREFFFGDVVEGKMQLNKIGEIVKQQWYNTPELRPDMNLKLDAFVIMPNHIHGIIIIGKNQYNTGRDRETDRGDAMHRVSTYKKTEKQTNIKSDVIIPANPFGPQSKNLASVIRGFKSSVTTQAKISGYNDFAWQTRYHDHIIRNSAEFYRIRKYIMNNPANWDKDKFHD